MERMLRSLTAFGVILLGCLLLLQEFHSSVQDDLQQAFLAERDLREDDAPVARELRAGGSADAVTSEQVKEMVAAQVAAAMKEKAEKKEKAADVHAPCNPTSCPDGLTCKSPASLVQNIGDDAIQVIDQIMGQKKSAGGEDRKCCEAKDWSCCGSDAEKFTNRLYCPEGLFTCTSGMCVHDASKCGEGGESGIKFSNVRCIDDTKEVSKAAATESKASTEEKASEAAPSESPAKTTEAATVTEAPAVQQKEKKEEKSAEKMVAVAEGESAAEHKGQLTKLKKKVSHMSEGQLDDVIDDSKDQLDDLQDQKEALEVSVARVDQKIDNTNADIVLLKHQRKEVIRKKQTVAEVLKMKKRIMELVHQVEDGLCLVFAKMKEGPKPFWNWIKEAGPVAGTHILHALRKLVIDYPILALMFLACIAAASGVAALVYFEIISLGLVFDMTTASIMLLDVGSDMYVAYSYWLHAQAFHQFPLFFSCSVFIMSLSAIFGVGYTLFDVHETLLEDYLKPCAKSFTEAMKGVMGGPGELLAAFILFILAIVSLFLLLPFGMVLPIFNWVRQKVFSSREEELLEEIKEGKEKLKLEDEKIRDMAEEAKEAKEKLQTSISSAEAEASRITPLGDILVALTSRKYHAKGQKLKEELEKTKAEWSMRQRVREQAEDIQRQIDQSERALHRERNKLNFIPFYLWTHSERRPIEQIEERLEKLWKEKEKIESNQTGVLKTETLGWISGLHVDQCLQIAEKVYDLEEEQSKKTFDLAFLMGWSRSADSPQMLRKQLSLLQFDESNVIRVAFAAAKREGRTDDVAEIVGRLLVEVQPAINQMENQIQKNQADKAKLISERNTIVQPKKADVKRLTDEIEAADEKLRKLEEAKELDPLDDVVEEKKGFASFFQSKEEENKKRRKARQERDDKIQELRKEKQKLIGERNGATADLRQATADLNQSIGDYDEMISAGTSQMQMLQGQKSRHLALLEEETLAINKQLRDLRISRDALENLILEKEIQYRMRTHIPFYIETLVESTPQSLLQVTAMVIYSHSSKQQINWVSILSITISLSSIMSKMYVMCSSKFFWLFVFKYLCCCHDITLMFYTLSALWDAENDSTDAVKLFFLTRKVDYFSAIWCVHFFLEAAGVIFAIACAVVAGGLFTLGSFLGDHGVTPSSGPQGCAACLGATCVLFPIGVVVALFFSAIATAVAAMPVFLVLEIARLIFLVGLFWKVEDMLTSKDSGDQSAVLAFVKDAYTFLMDTPVSQRPGALKAIQWALMEGQPMNADLINFHIPGQAEAKAKKKASSISPGDHVEVGHPPYGVATEINTLGRKYFKENFSINQTTLNKHCQSSYRDEPGYMKGVRFSVLDMPTSDVVCIACPAGFESFPGTLEPIPHMWYLPVAAVKRLPDKQQPFFRNLSACIQRNRARVRWLWANAPPLPGWDSLPAAPSSEKLWRDCTVWNMLALIVSFIFYMCLAIFIFCIGAFCFLVCLGSFTAAVIVPMCGYLFGILYSFLYPFLSFGSSVYRFCEYDEMINPFQLWLFVVYVGFLITLITIYRRYIHCLVVLLSQIFERDATKPFPDKFFFHVKPSAKTNIQSHNANLDYLTNQFNEKWSKEAGERIKKANVRARGWCWCLPCCSNEARVDDYEALALEDNEGDGEYTAGDGEYGLLGMK